MLLEEPKVPNALVTLLLTDIEGSTRIWEEEREPMREALEIHDALALEVVSRFGGTIVKSRGEGDSLFIYFLSPFQALEAAAALQRAFATAQWPTRSPIQVRAGIHCGDVVVRDRDLYGPSVNRCARIRACGYGGQVLVSHAVERLVSLSFPTGLSLKPLGRVRLKDLLEPEALFQLAGDGLGEEFPPLRTIDQVPNNLPIQLQTYIGREKEVKVLIRRIEKHRLISLLGTGGVGKTRLALQVAAEAMEFFSGGIAFVDLAAYQTGQVLEAIQSAIESVLGRTILGGDPVSRLAELEFILVLDNCEHVIDEAAKICAALLPRLPALRILATTREALQIKGEHLYRVESLGLPPAEPTFEACAESEAVQLFVERARERLSSFDLTPENCIDIAAICTEIDGIPLAIEHAAGQIGNMTPADMRVRLRDVFGFLRTRERHVLQRHITIKATLDWSFHTLTEEERKLFPLLSIFRASWSLSQCEAIASSLGLKEWEVDDAIHGLQSKSLVMLEGTAEGPRRFRLLETTKAYGREKISEEDRSGAIQGLFDYYCRTLSEPESPFASNSLMSLSTALTLEMPNLELVVDWGIQLKDPRTLQILYQLRDSIRRGGMSRRGTTLFRAALDAGFEASAAEIARIWNALGNLLWSQELYREAEVAYENSKPFFQEAGDEQGLIGITNNLAMIHDELGHTARAIELFEEAAAGFKQVGNEARFVQVQHNLGLLNIKAGAPEVALIHFEVVAGSEPSDPNHRASFYKSHALAHLMVGHLAESLKLLNQAFEIWTEHEDVPILAAAVIDLATIGGGDGACETQAILIGASFGLESFTGSYATEYEKKSREATLSLIERQLGPNRLQAALQVGKSMTSSECATYASSYGKRLAAQGLSSVEATC